MVSTVQSVDSQAFITKNLTRQVLSADELNVMLGQYIHAYIHSYIHMHTYIHTHAYIHSYIHTHTLIHMRIITFAQHVQAEGHVLLHASVHKNTPRIHMFIYKIDIFTYMDA